MLLFIRRRQQVGRRSNENARITIVVESLATGFPLARIRGRESTRKRDGWPLVLLIMFRAPLPLSCRAQGSGDRIPIRAVDSRGHRRKEDGQRSRAPGFPRIGYFDTRYRVQSAVCCSECKPARENGVTRVAGKTRYELIVSA